MNELSFDDMVFFDAGQGRIFDGLEYDLEPICNNFTDFPEVADDSPAILLVEEDHVDCKRENLSGLKLDYYHHPGFDPEALINSTEGLSQEVKAVDIVDSCSLSKSVDDFVTEDQPIYLDKEFKDNKMNKIVIEQRIYTSVKKLSKRQEAIDEGLAYKTGPGRARKHPHKSSSELLSIIKDYIRTGINKIINNSKCLKRKDLMVTAYFRVIKKLPYFLIEKWSTNNLYKRNITERYILAFAEAYSAFTFAIGDIQTNKAETIKKYIEFSVIYYPYEKWRPLIYGLLQGADEQMTAFLNTQLEILKNRENTTKKNIRCWSLQSKCLRQILELGLDILSEQKLSKSSAVGELKTLTQWFLASQ